MLDKIKTLREIIEPEASKLGLSFEEMINHLDEKTKFNYFLKQIHKFAYQTPFDYTTNFNDFFRYAKLNYFFKLSQDQYLKIIELVQEKRAKKSQIISEAHKNMSMHIKEARSKKISKALKGKKLKGDRLTFCKNNLKRNQKKAVFKNTGKFQCQYCDKIGSYFPAITRHEKSCTKNPEYIPKPKKKRVYKNAKSPEYLSKLKKEQGSKLGSSGKGGKIRSDECLRDFLEIFSKFPEVFTYQDVLKICLDSGYSKAYASNCLNRTDYIKNLTPLRGGPIKTIYCKSTVYEKECKNYNSISPKNSVIKAMSLNKEYSSREIKKICEKFGHKNYRTIINHKSIVKIGGKARYKKIV